MPSLTGVQTCALRSEEHTSELQSLTNIVCRLLLEKKKHELKLEKKYLDEFKIAEEFLQISKNSLDLSLRTSANRLYFAFEKAVISYLLFNKKIVQKNIFLSEKLIQEIKERLGNTKKVFIF